MFGAGRQGQSISQPGQLADLPASLPGDRLHSWLLLPEEVAVAVMLETQHSSAVAVHLPEEVAVAKIQSAARVQQRSICSLRSPAP